MKTNKKLINPKTVGRNVALGFGAFAVVFALAILASCDNEPKPQPGVPQLTEQSKDIIIRDDVTCTINYIAVTGTTPVWLDTLVSVFENRAAVFFAGHYTLTVQTTGTDGFVAGAAGTKTATVSDAFLTASDYTAMRASMGPMISSWMVMIQPMHDNGWQRRVTGTQTV